MINSNELLYVVDEYDIPQKPRPRNETLKNGYWHRAVHIWIVNDKRQILCQKRSLKKDLSPGMWEPAIVGHLGPDDNYFTGAVREVTEETGIPIDASDLNLLKIYKDNKSHEYRGVFYCKLNLELQHIKREDEEVEKIKLVKLQTLRKYLLYQQPNFWIRLGYEKEMFSILN